MNKLLCKWTTVCVFLMNTGSSGLRDLNGLLIPNITMYRCITYTVIVDGGLAIKLVITPSILLAVTEVDTLPNPLLRDRYPFHIQGVNMY